MTYATQADMIARFGEDDLIRLTDRDDPPLEAVDATVLAAAQADAAATIDSFVASRYTLPLSPAPRVLAGIECDLAWFNLQRGRVTEDAQKRKDDALRFLRDVSAGKASLGPDASNALPAEAGGVLVTSTDPVFSPETLSDY